MKYSILFRIVLIATVFSAGVHGQHGDVSVRTFNQVFPTYNMGPDDPSTYFKDFSIPGMHFFRSSRSVYPYTFVNDYQPGRDEGKTEGIPA